MEKKKLFFYANVRCYDKTVGITRKVFEQIDAFKKLGNEVYYCGYLEKGVAIFDNEHKIIKAKSYFFKNNLLNHILRRYMLILLCTNFFKETEHKFNFCYLRYHFFDMFYNNLLKVMKKNNAKIILEVHSYPVFPKKTTLNIIKILDKIYSQNVAKYIDIIAAMNNYKEIWGIKTFEIDNTLNIENFNLKISNSIGNEFIFVNIAFENYTHGLDRIIKGIKIYNDTKENKIKVKLILIGEYLNSTKRLVSSLGLNQSIIFVGKKNKDEINEYVDMAHFAVGSLGNHRTDSFYGSALKTKEYIARGIPFVYGWNEKILKNFKYSFKVELNEKPINIEEIIKFYRSIFSKELSQQMRNYLLENNKTWEVQFKELFSLLEDNDDENSF